jgi:aryl-alcohol dehydrogenase-like predicted oxidoreductase
LGAFDDLIRSGKVLYIGFSEWNAAQIAAALKIQDQKGYYRFVSSQPQYSMLWRVIESEVVPLCEKEGIAQGVLRVKYLPGQKAPAGSRATDKKGGAEMISKFMTNQVLTAVQKLIPIAKKVDLTPAQLAIAWVLSNSNVSSAIIGATKPAQIKENVKAAGVKLDKQILSEIDAVLAGVVEKDPAKTVSPNPRA